MEAPRKRRKLSFNVPKQPVPFQWESPFNKEGKLQFCLLNWEMEPQVLGEMGGTMVAETVFITTCICIS